MTADTSIVETTCAICGKTLTGKKCDWNTFSQQKISYDLQIGRQCRSCGASYCADGHSKELKFSLWSGYEKSPCLHCKEPLGTGFLLLDPSVEIAPSEITVPTVCPQCSGTNISPVKNTGMNILWLVIGGAFLFGFLLFDIPPFENENLNAAFKFFGVFMGVWIIWDILTRRPFPIIGMKLFQEDANTRVKCSDCGYQWAVIEKTGREQIS